MKIRTDALSLLIFFLMLAGVLYLSINGFVKKILNYDYNGDETIVYVNKDAIDLPDTDFNYQNISFQVISEPYTDFPAPLSREKLIYQAKELPVKDLSVKSEESLEDLKNTLTKYLSESLEYSKSKNEDFATLQNLFKIRSFEEDARDLLNSKIKENTPYKLSSYLDSLANNGHMEIMNTDKNRENAGIAFSKYLLYRNAYMNYFYLYRINVERYRLQENQKAISEVNKKFNDYEAGQKEIINQKILLSEKNIQNIINNIDISKENKVFSYQNIKFNKNEKTNSSSYSPVDIKDLSALNNKEKEKIIIEIGKDYNYKVTFKENPSLEDKTDEFQNLINKYGDLYRM